MTYGNLQFLRLQKVFFSHFYGKNYSLFFFSIHAKQKKNQNKKNWKKKVRKYKITNVRNSEKQLTLLTYFSIQYNVIHGEICLCLFFFNILVRTIALEELYKRYETYNSKVLEWCLAALPYEQNISRRKILQNMFLT